MFCVVMVVGQTFSSAWNGFGRQECLPHEVARLRLKRGGYNRGVKDLTFS
jgi:hypothetical protein